MRNKVEYIWLAIAVLLCTIPFRIAICDECDDMVGAWSVLAVEENGEKRMPFSGMDICFELFSDGTGMIYTDETLSSVAQMSWRFERDGLVFTTNGTEKSYQWQRSNTLSLIEPADGSRIITECSIGYLTDGQYWFARTDQLWLKLWGNDDASTNNDSSGITGDWHSIALETDGMISSQEMDGYDQIVLSLNEDGTGSMHYPIYGETFAVTWMKHENDIVIKADQYPDHEIICTLEQRDITVSDMDMSVRSDIGFLTIENGDETLWFVQENQIWVHMGMQQQEPITAAQRLSENRYRITNIDYFREGFNDRNIVFLYRDELNKRANRQDIPTQVGRNLLI